jgi:hypothetical protein
MFGREWRAPMTLIVLVAFALGLAAGVLGMLLGWRRRRVKIPAARQIQQPAASAQTADQPQPATGPLTDSILTAREF